MKRRIDKVAHSRAKDKEQAPQDGYRMIQAGWPLAMRLDLVCTGSATSRTPNAAQTRLMVSKRGCIINGVTA